MLRAFWERTDCSIGLLNHLSREIASTDSRWYEAIDDFPNNLQFRDAYVTYLIEGPSRFSEAVLQKYRAVMIENGHDFRVDISFQRFVRKFPGYLRREIIDIKGVIIKQARSVASHASSASSAQEDVADALDIGMEEALGAAMITQARVRLTVERAFLGRLPATFTVLVGVTAAVLLVCLAGCIFVDLYFASYFSSRGDVATRVAEQMLARFYMMSSLFSWVQYWAEDDSVNAIGASVRTTLQEQDQDLTWPSFFSHNVTWDVNAMNFNVRGRDQYESMVTSVMAMAKDGIDVFTYARLLFDEHAMPLQFCKGPSTYGPPWTGNMRTAWTFLYIQTSLIGANPNPASWFTHGSEPLCMVVLSLPHSLEPLRQFREDLGKMSKDAAQDASALLTPLSYALPGSLFIFSTVLFGIAGLLYAHDIKTFSTLLLNLPKAVKRECLKPLRCDDVRDDTRNTATTSVLEASNFSIPALFNTIILLVLAACLVVLFFQILNIEDYNLFFDKLGTWWVAARARKCYVVEAALATSLVVFDKNPLTTPVEGVSRYINGEEMTSLTRNSIVTLTKLNRDLIGSTEDSDSSSVGLDPEIDAYTMKAQCVPNLIDTVHGYYRCASATQMIQYVSSALLEVIVDPSLLQGKVDDDITFAHIPHILDMHILPMLLRIDDLFSALEERFQGDFIRTHRIFLIIELLLLFLTAVLVCVYSVIMNNCYSVLLVLLRKVAPAHILASESLEAYLLNRSPEHRRVGLTADERIIDSSADSIICMGPTGVIDMINPAVTKVFGYTPEQLLGQLLLSLLTQDQTEKVGAQLKLMADRHSGPFYEGHTTCLTDDEKELPCSISLLAIFENGEISSFVAMLKDEKDE
jgi:PAS domain S-box-containing protein